MRPLLGSEVVQEIGTVQRRWPGRGVDIVSENGIEWRGLGGLILESGFSLGQDNIKQFELIHLLHIRCRR